MKRQKLARHFRTRIIIEPDSALSTCRWPLTWRVNTLASGCPCTAILPVRLIKRWEAVRTLFLQSADESGQCFLLLLFYFLFTCRQGWANEMKNRARQKLRPYAYPKPTPIPAHHTLTILFLTNALSAYSETWLSAWIPFYWFESGPENMTKSGKL